MKILMSAYACEPNVGSESGIGWRWATEAAKLGHEVTVITRGIYRRSIEKELSSEEFPNLAFEYYDLPAFLQWKVWGKLWPIKYGLYFYWHIWHYPYHFFWQKGAYKKALQLNNTHEFNVIHHVTFGTIRRSSYMGRLGIPFIFGPVGGGERTPLRLRKIFSRRAQLNEIVRDLSILLTMLNPWIRGTCKRADKIYLKTPDSAYLVPKKYRGKAEVKLEIGIDHPVDSPIAQNNSESSPKQFEILYVGRFLYWKGMDYGLRAFAKFVKACPGARLTMVGKGPDEDSWRKLAQDLGIEKNIRWVQWVDKKELSDFYLKSDLFLFPSLHDSSGNVVLEAISHGLPVVCLDLGGPAAIVDDTCAVRVSTRGKKASQVVEDLADEITTLWSDREQLYSLRTGALEKRKQYLWQTIIGKTYGVNSKKLG